MADDVAQKAIDANTIKQGIAIVGVQPNGNRKTEETYVDSSLSIEEIAADLTERFDDPSYYEA